MGSVPDAMQTPPGQQLWGKHPFYPINMFSGYMGCFCCHRAGLDASGEGTVSSLNTGGSCHAFLWDPGSDRNVSPVTVCVTGQPRTRKYIEFPESLLAVSQAAAQGGGSALHIAVIYWWAWVRAFSFSLLSLFICNSAAVPFSGFPAQVRGSREGLCSVTAICRCDWHADGTSSANPYVPLRKINAFTQTYLWKGEHQEMKGEKPQKGILENTFCILSCLFEIGWD